MNIAQSEPAAPHIAPPSAARRGKIRLLDSVGPALQDPAEALIPRSPGGKARELDNDPLPGGIIGTPVLLEAGPETAEELRAAMSGIIDRIRRLEPRIAGAEDKAVECSIHKGRSLAELKTLAAAAGRGAWGAMLDKLHLSPRVATRYITIGTWGNDLGLIESGTIRKLPFDLLKLESLAKLDRDQLGELIGKLDPRTKSRAEIIKAVKRITGQARPAPRDDAGRRSRAIDRLITQLIKLLSLADDDLKQRVAGRFADAFGGPGEARTR